MCGLAGVVGVGVTATWIPDLFATRRANWNDTAAIGALKTIGAAQTLFREADKEQDGKLDYGTLKELGGNRRTGLIDSILASGTKQGYIFESSYSQTTSEFLWFATARPTIPTVTGDPYFATNHEGAIYFSLTGPIPMNTDDCSFPADRLKSGDIGPLNRWVPSR